MGIQSPSFVAEQCDDSVLLERMVADGEDNDVLPIKQKSEQDDKEFLPVYGNRE